MRHIFLFFFLFLSVTVLRSENFIVNSQSSFNNALNASSAGDTIFWENGVFNNIFLDIDEDDIVVTAIELGQTVFSSNSYAEISGDNVVFRGFQYLNGNIGDEHVIDITGDDVTIIEINIEPTLVINICV